MKRLFRIFELSKNEQRVVLIVMAIAQQRNASGAADPSPFATVAGITKIPAPIVELTIFAVSAGIPMPRTN